MMSQKIADGVHGYPGGQLLRVSVDARGNGREGDGLRADAHSFLKGAAVGGGEKFRLAVRASLPHRSNGVNDKFCGQAEARRGFGVACWAAAKRPARGEEFRPCGSVDGAVHAASAEKPVVGRVDDGVYVLFCDVPFDETQAIFSFFHGFLRGGRVRPPACFFLSYTTDSMAPRY